MDVVGKTHIVARTQCSFVLQLVVGVGQGYVLGKHLDFSHSCYRIRSLVGSVGGIVACSKYVEAVVLQSQDIHTLEGIDNLRIVDVGSCKAVTCQVGTAEAGSIRLVSISEDTTFTVVFIYFLVGLRLLFRLLISVSIEIAVLERDVTVVAVFVHVIVAEEVGTCWQYD